MIEWILSLLFFPSSLTDLFISRGDVIARDRNRF